MTPLEIASRQYGSRLLVGTGKFSSPSIMAQAVGASGAQLVTVALRRMGLGESPEPGRRLTDHLPFGIHLLPNTSGATSAEEAVPLAELGRAVLATDLIKLDVMPDGLALGPDPVETLRAAETLVGQGFTVLPRCPADPVVCRRLEEAGCAAVMPLGSWVGSTRGLRTRDALEAIIGRAGVPVIVDAGIGAPSDAAEAMEIGASAVLVNTAIATATDPVAMARAFALGVEAGQVARGALCGPVLSTLRRAAASRGRRTSQHHGRAVHS